MADIDQLIQDVLRREGGFVNHPADRGGPTNYGITQKTLSLYMGRAAMIADVEDLSPDLAAEIYRQNYFFKPAINTLPEAIQPFIFDSAVNHGPRRAIKFVQYVVNDAGYSPRLDDDGAMGPNTRRGAEWAQDTMGDVFQLALFEERKNFYRIIVANNPSQEVFFKGWINRVKEFEKEFEEAVA